MLSASDSEWESKWNFRFWHFNKTKEWTCGTSRPPWFLFSLPSSFDYLSPNPPLSWPPLTVAARVCCKIVLLSSGLGPMFESYTPITESDELIWARGYWGPHFFFFYSQFVSLSMKTGLLGPGAKARLSDRAMRWDFGLTLWAPEDAACLLSRLNFL